MTGLGPVLLVAPENRTDFQVRVRKHRTTFPHEQTMCTKLNLVHANYIRHVRKYLL